MTTVKAEYDGKVFVPAEPVQLAAGTRVEVLIPPRQPTPEENRQWQEILRKLDSTEPHFATVEEAVQYLRKRP